MERDKHSFLGKRWKFRRKHNCLREFPNTTLLEVLLGRKIRSWKTKWPYQNYRTGLTFILICMCRCVSDFWVVSYQMPTEVEIKKLKIKAPLLIVTEICFVPQYYDFKCCCHLWHFVLFGRKYLYPVWLASVEYFGCFSFQFKKESVFVLAVCLNLL